MSLRLFGVLLALSLCVSLQAQAADPSPPVIVLKLDDIVQPSKDGMAIHPAWQRVTDFLAEKKIRASYGIIGESLEKDNPAYFAWIKNLHEKGDIEFWCHGYHLRTAEEKTGEFESGTAEEQQAKLARTVQLAKEKLGIELHAFGPHWTGTTEETEKAMQAVPELTIWLYGPAKSAHYTKTSLVRIMAIENPTFVPDVEKFKDTYNKFGKKQKVLVLQGHPAQWNDQRWEGFKQIIAFLQEQNCTFMTPSEYVKSLKP